MKYLNYILILVGAITAIYAKAYFKQNSYILIGGLVVLMVGVYRLSKTIPSKPIKNDNDNSIDKL